VNVDKSAAPEAVGLPPAERLVNLTAHGVVLVSQQPPFWLAGQAGTAPLVHVPADGGFARVDDDAVRLGERLLNTTSGLISLTRLRRGGRLVDLPAPEPGIRYVVSRLTALAARGRDDLVFPFGEIREADGRITGARGLGSFGISGSPWRRLGEWRAAAREGRASRPLSRPWLTGVLFAVATALLSGALGTLPGALDGVQPGRGMWTSWEMRLTVAFGAAGMMMLAGAAWRWYAREVAVEERGTAYVINEMVPVWRHEEKAAVLTEAGSGFAAALLVPGPRELGENWDWTVGPQAAPQWDARVDQLVNSFWAVHYNDSKVTRNAVFVWAPWPVAMAFGARVTARGRGLVLHVRQRPSYGAAGPHRRPRLSDNPHDFGGVENVPVLEEIAPRHQPVTATTMLTLTVRPLGAPDHQTGRTGRREGHPVHAARSETGILLLVVRVTHGPVGPIEMDLAKTRPFTLEVSPGLATDVVPAGPHHVPVAELRLGAREPDGPAVPELDWMAFPSAVNAIADWVTGQAAERKAKVVLLAARMPQEIAVGLGVQLTQRSQAREKGEPWPWQVYPAIFTGDPDRLAVPGLRLGACSVPGQRA
jgi:hypothetical protein